jgi:hypothetical protein
MNENSLQTLDKLATVSAALGETLPSLIKRLEKANLGYVINNQFRKQAEKETYRLQQGK